jgi:hypothetical protein
MSRITDIYLGSSCREEPEEVMEEDGDENEDSDSEASLDINLGGGDGDEDASASAKVRLNTGLPAKMIALTLCAL